MNNMLILCYVEGEQKKSKFYFVNFPVTYESRIKVLYIHAEKENNPYYSIPKNFLGQDI